MGEDERKTVGIGHRAVDDLRESYSTIKGEVRVQDNKEWVNGKKLQIKIIDSSQN